MPKWQIALVVIGSVCTVFGCAIGVVYFFDKYFRTRRASDRDREFAELQRKVGELERNAPTKQQSVDAEHRLSRIEGDVFMLKETQELREKVMSQILRSDRRE